MESQNQIVTVISQSSVETETAVMLKNAFMPFFDEANKWAESARQIIVTDESQTDLMASARKARLELKNIRIAAEKKRKELKEDSLRYGKAVQGVYNVIEFVISPIEKHLEQQERFVEIQAEKKKAEIKEARTIELAEYQEYVPLGIDYGSMVDDDFQKLLSGAMAQKTAKEEAEKKAAAEKIEKEKRDAEERARIEAENAKLKEIAAENETKLKEAREAKEKAEAEQRKIEAENKRKKEEEDKIKAAAEEADRKAKNAPDKEKILAFINVLSSLEYPDVKNAEAQNIVDFAKMQIGKIASSMTAHANML